MNFVYLAFVELDIIRCRLCVSSQKLYADYFFFYKLNVDCVFYSAVMGEMTSISISLLWTLVAMGG
jgi:hypothetical protein